MTDKSLMKQYKMIAKRELAKPEVGGVESLRGLTDRELFIFITARTRFMGGRSLGNSIENAKSHLHNRARAEQLFGTKDPEE